MAKITLPTIASGFNSNTQFNNAFDSIETEFQSKVLYRNNPDGEPNQMEDNLDMNGFDILNIGALVIDGVDLTTQAASASASALAASASASSASASALSAAASANGIVNLEYIGPWQPTTLYYVNNIVTEAGSTYICVVEHTSGTFNTDLIALKWAVLASKGSAGVGAGDLLAANNLSDVTSAATALANLGGQPLNAKLTDISNWAPPFAMDFLLNANDAATANDILGSGYTGYTRTPGWFTPFEAGRIYEYTGSGRSTTLVPDPAGRWWYTIKNSGTGNLVITSLPGVLIEGAASYTLLPGELCTIYTLPEDSPGTWAGNTFIITHRTYRPAAAIEYSTLKLASGTISAAATLPIVLSNYCTTSDYAEFILVLDEIRPATNATGFYLRLSSDGGSTYASSGYMSAVDHFIGDNTVRSYLSTTNIEVIHNSGNTNAGNIVGEGYDGEIRIINPSATKKVKVEAKGVYTTAAGPMGRNCTYAKYNTAVAIDALQLRYSSGNIASGKWTLYGVKA